MKAFAGFCFFVSVFQKGNFHVSPYQLNEHEITLIFQLRTASPKETQNAI